MKPPYVEESTLLAEHAINDQIITVWKDFAHEALSDEP
jgi:hypothetical protein